MLESARAFLRRPNEHNELVEENQENGENNEEGEFESADEDDVYVWVVW